MSSRDNSKSLGAGTMRSSGLTSEARRAAAMFMKNKAAVAGALVLAVLFLVALLPNQIAPYDPLGVVPQDSRQGPSRAHWMGTDLMGRDILSRVIHGTRLSLLIGLSSVSIGTVVGTALGISAGYFGGYLDLVVMRVMDALLAFPAMLLAMLIIVALGTEMQNVMIAVGVATIPRYARLARGTVLSAKEEIYVMAARAIGAQNVRIMTRHILPAVVGPIIVLASLQFGVAIITAAGLSFLGLGAQPPTPEWGLMVAMGKQYLGKAWWMSTFPGLTITIAVISINTVGDGLREVLDPTLRIG